MHSLQDAPKHHKPRKRIDPTRKRRPNAVLTVFRDISICFIAATLVLIAFSASIDYACKKADLADNSAISILFALCAGAVLVIGRITIKRSVDFEQIARSKPFFTIIGTMSLLLFALQMAILNQAWFETGWDIFALSDVNNYLAWSDYFSQYPNQYLLAGLFQAISNIAAPLDLGSNYLPLVIGGCVCISISVFLTGIIAKNISGYPVGYFAFFISFGFVGLSPWLFVPYSDAYGILCPTITLFIYTSLKRSWVKWPIMLFVSIVGYHIKPTSIFILLAISFVEFIALLANLKKYKMIEASGPQRKHGGYTSFAAITSSIVAIAMALSLCVNAKPSEIDQNPEKAFSSAHFLMMGFNFETRGVFSSEDAIFSGSFEKKDERTRANIEMWISRISDLGFQGTASLLAEKNLTNYNDGSLAWGIEGSFFVTLHGSPGPVRDFYGIPNTDGEPYQGSPFERIAHFVWMFILVGCVLSILNRKPSKGEIAIYLTILALSAFLMVFEARARYLFLYAPYFCIAASLGWCALARFLERHLNLRKRDGERPHALQR